MLLMIPWNRDSNLYICSISYWNSRILFLPKLVYLLNDYFLSQTPRLISRPLSKKSVNPCGKKGTNLCLLIFFVGKTQEFWTLIVVENDVFARPKMPC